MHGTPIGKLYYKKGMSTHNQFVYLTEDPSLVVQ